MYQKLEIIGRVTGDAEMKYTPDMKAVTNFTVAVNEKRGEKEKTTWVRVAAWNGLAEVCGKFVKKGMLVFCEGRLNADESGNPRTFSRNDGTPGANYEMTAYTVKFLSKVEAGEPATPDYEDIPF